MLRGNTHFLFFWHRENTLEVNFLAVNEKHEISLKEKNITLKQGCIYSLSCAFAAGTMPESGADGGFYSGLTLCCATASRHDVVQT